MRSLPVLLCRLLGYFESGRYLGEFAPSDIEEGQDEPLLANTGLR